MMLRRVWPRQPEELVGFLTSFDAPLVEKSTQLASHDELKALVFKYGPVFYMGQREFEELFIRLKNDYASRGLNAVPQNLAAIA